MAITYNAGTNTITVVGYTEGTPCNFTDIYNADVAGSWGVVSRQCTNQFCFDCKLEVGDGTISTWFKDTGKGWTFAHGILSANNQNLFKFYVNSNVHLISCYIVILENTYRSFNGGSSASSVCCKIDDCAFYTVLPSAGSNLGHVLRYFDSSGYIKHSLFYNLAIIVMGAELNRLTLQTPDVPAGTVVYNLSGTINDINISDCEIATQFAGTQNPTFKNLCTSNVGTYEIRVTSLALDGDYINCDFGGTWRISWIGTSTAHILRKYEFDLKVIDKDNNAINGATVQIWDKDSNLIVDTTTNASGVIATQTITRGYYNQANGDTLQEASPHLIKIEKDGYTNYEADFTLEEKTDWLVALQGVLKRNPSMTGGMV